LRRALLAFFVLAFGLVASAGNAHAELSPQGVSNRKVEWKDGQWPRVTPWEIAASVAATGLGLVLESTWEGVSFEEDVQVPLLDPGARGLLRGRTAKVQKTFDRLSNIGWRMMAFFPYVDVGVSALAIHRNFDVAGQMALMDFEALTLSGLTYVVASHSTGRARPYRQDCASPQDDTVTKGCGVPFDNRSFYGGHAAAAFTSAGLTCAHHQHLPLYGGGAVETWACVWALTVASATGIFRIVADEHYASDILVGSGVGWFYGYVMPKLLHYKGAQREPHERKATVPTWMPSFRALDGGGVFSIGTTL
jgi:membrane-associated phospholipid phosphatase